MRPSIPTGSWKPAMQLKATNAWMPYFWMKAMAEMHWKGRWKNLKGAEKWAEAAAESLKNLKNKPKARCRALEVF